QADLLEAGVAVTADDIVPVGERVGRGVRRAREEVHRVEAAHERGRATRRPRRDEFLLDQDDAAGFFPRQMIGQARAVDAAADDDDIRAPGNVYHSALAVTRRFL